MTEVLDVNSLSLASENVLFDTNIWIFIEGFCGSGARQTDIYSNAYSRLLKQNNTIFVNDYVLGEFSNRCSRYEYDLLKGADASLPSYKRYRRSSDFRPVMESIRDTCLHILEDCEYLSVGKSECDLERVMEEFHLGEIDFSDLMLANHCCQEKLYLMTDDMDFQGRGVPIITANKRLLTKTIYS
jgi:predicted nucleic acid-binding protein